VFAASVRREREARGWTPTELARKSGITQGTIVNIEAGRHGASLRVAAGIAGAFGTTIGALVDKPGAGQEGRAS
jgi:HTH-type transcriptional regulator / antitoxin HipB